MTDTSPTASPLDLEAEALPTDAGQTLNFASSTSITGTGEGPSTNRTTVIIANHRAASGREGLRFELIEELGRGGMGVVLRGRDPDLHREVAVKLLRHSGDERREARFVAEAQITGQLEHPNIIPVHEFGRDSEGRPWFAMKLIRGQTMADVLTSRAKDREVENAWPTSRLLQILVQVCHAVAFAHSRGVIHRDLKPANIMLGDFGEVLVVDWGLGKAVGNSSVESVRDGRQEPAEGPGSEANITLDGAIIGTPCYMPPEQARGELDRLGPHGDVFALGASLCEIIGGRPPITGGSVSEVVRKASSGDIVIPDRDWRGQRVPRELTAIIRRAMAYRPEDRYSGCQVLAEDLQRYLEHRAVSVVDATLWDAVGKFVRRHTLATAVGGVASVALVASLAGGYVLKERERLQALEARTVAESQRSRAEEALQQVEAQRRLTETGRKRERTLAIGSERQARLMDRSRAAALLAQADASLARGRRPGARTLLNEIPREERDWCWRHLAALAAGSGEVVVQGRPDDQLVTAGSGFALVAADGRMRFISAAGTERAGPAFGRPVLAVAADPAGKTIAAILAGGALAQVDGSTGRIIGNRLGLESLRTVAVADGLVVTGTTQGIRWFKAAENGERSFPGLTMVAVAPSLDWWAACGSSGMQITSGSGERRVSLTDMPTALAVSRDGSHLAGLVGTHLRWWAMPNGTVEADGTPGPSLTCLSLAEGEVVALGSEEGTVLVWDQELGLPLLRRETGGPVAQVLWSGDSRVLAIRLHSGEVRLLRD